MFQLSRASTSSVLLQPFLMAREAAAAAAGAAAPAAGAAVRELLTSGAFKGAVVDLGCGIGDNALFIKKYTNCTVDAVDMLPKCITFAEMKAGLRNMRETVNWQCFDLMLWDESPLARAGRSLTYDVALDSGLLHCMDRVSRRRYLQVVHDHVLKPGGMMFVLALSDQEMAPGGPARVSRAELEQLFSTEAGWALQYVRPHFIELHPTFWGGKGQAYLVAAQKLDAGAGAAGAGPAACVGGGAAGPSANRA
ncbi:hypothetical protein HYH02_004716 [Chlamydomonas schloesseri]|uniref:Methyltransferase domain-containing protein n=1 Tax=Chlamydomonas schloesseri TaxID=2026947 RepID=A0A835WN58_9CHLO|nr:hypothetical protein HYH02_004716 [Chlamydomonas schloesseri]|eukprot:KAG2450884.1 hypothetical protein HYH02_004716 [Chlamydomonas schloesseri]